MFIGLGLLVGLLFYQSPEPIIVLKGSGGLSVDRYASDAQALLSGSLLNSTKLTLRRSAIENEMRIRFPELQSVRVESDVLGRRPTFILAAEDILFRMRTEAETVMIGSSGRIVGYEADFPRVSNTLQLIDESGIDQSIGTLVMRSDDAMFLNRAREIIALKGRGVDYIRITEVPREAYIKPSDRSYQVRVYLDDSVEEQLGAWFLTEKTLEGRGEGVAQYIDVRAGEKVFVL
jgi:hypothetical protein